MSPPHHNWAAILFKNFNNNPETQIRFHWWMMRFWEINLVVGSIIVFFFPTDWLKIGVFYVFCLSLYANWDTDAGSMTAAQAHLYSREAALKLEVTATDVSNGSSETVDIIVKQAERHIATGAEQPPETFST